MKTLNLSKGPRIREVAITKTGDFTTDFTDKNGCRQLRMQQAEEQIAGWRCDDEAFVGAVVRKAITAVAAG